MMPTCAKSRRRWATAAATGWSFVRYDAHHARWCIVLTGRVDILARLAAVQPPHTFTALSQGGPRGRPAQIGEGAADVYLPRPAHRSSLCLGIALAKRDSG